MALADELDAIGGAHTGPLSGVRVLDLSRMIAGPVCAMFLGELGAAVIKVERAGKGDDARMFAPFTADGESPYFMSYNRGKASVALELDSPSGQQAVRRLATEWADVVIENFKDGTLERWNLALADLRAANPALITATVRGYPEGDSRPGYDFIIQAGSGVMALTGPPDGEPFRVGLPVCDINAGHYLTSGVMAALYERTHSGRGQHLSVSLWEAQVGGLFHVGQEYLMLGKKPPRMGNGNASAGPYGVYPTATTPVAVCVGNDTQFAGMAKEFDHLEWLEDERLRTNPMRAVNKDYVDETVQALFAGISADEVLKSLERAGVPCGAVRSIPEIFGEDAPADLVMSVPHSSQESVPAVRLPWKFSRSAVGPQHGAPVLGHDTEAVLAALDGRPDGE